MAAPSTSQVKAQMQALLDGPAARPPLGVEPNLENPSNINAIIIPILTLCLVISTVSILIRLYTKMFLIRSIAYEDYVIAIAWVGHIGFAVPSIYCFKVGGGTHMWDLRLKDFFRLLYWLNISGILYGIVVFLIKISILLQFLRIFVPNRRGNMVLFATIQVTIWSIFIFYLVDTGFEIAMCNPREKIWNLLMTTGHCFNANAAYIATGIFNVTSDFSIFILPMVPICKLQMPLKKKMLMLAIFATGACACATSILRTFYTFKILDSPDVSYNIIIMGLWTWAEITMGILISCLPVMPKFFQHFGTRVYMTLSSNSKSGPRLGRKFESPDMNRNAQISNPSNRTFMKYGGGSSTSDRCLDSREHQAPYMNKHVTSDEFQVALAKSKILNEQQTTINEGLATKREDLEAGR